ncbi:hypothetical protein ACSQ67_006111 [Phaseolus vulgaris]
MLYISCIFNFGNLRRAQVYFFISVIKFYKDADYVKVETNVLEVCDEISNSPSSAAARVAATKGPKPTIGYGMFVSSITCLVCLK